MSKIYRLSRSGLRLFHKIRHRRGHGIHSPFVFNLITKVIEEKASFYAYTDIKHFLKGHQSKKPKSKKINKLVFRLVNYFKAKNILEIGLGKGVNGLYLTASSRQICYNGVEISAKKRVKAAQLYQDWGHNMSLWDKLPNLEEKQDCIFVDLDSYDANYKEFISYLINLTTPQSFIILKGIRTNRNCRMLWNEMRYEKKVGITLDLFQVGIVFFDKKLHKRNYIVNF